MRRKRVRRYREDASFYGEAAARLADRLRVELRIDSVFPVQANAVFLHLSDALVRSLQERGWRFYKFLEPDVHRLMCSWSTSDEHITEFVDDVRSLQSS